MITVIAVAIPSELTMPNARKNNTRIKGSAIFISDMIVFFERTKPACLLAMKIESVIEDKVRNAVKKMNATANIIFSLIKVNAGDQIFTPITNITAISRDTTTGMVRQEFISSTGFSALDRKRIRPTSKPSLLNETSRPIADIMAAPRPTSASL